MSVNQETATRLDAIDDGMDELREILKFDAEDWRKLPKDLQDTINNVAQAMDELETTIAKQVGLRLRQ